MSLRSFFLSLWLCTAARAQFGGGGVVLRGEVQLDGAAPLVEKYVVDVSECGGGGIVGRTMLGFDNKFEVRDLKSGCKLVRIMSSDERRLLHEERVTVEGENTPVLLHVEGDRRPAVSSGTVSVERLRHPIPAKVLRALAETQKLSETGHVEEAASKLQKIVAQDPDLWEAHLNLGVMEMKLGRPADALASFSRARELEPRSSKVAVDSGIALIALHRVDEAESFAREALALDPTNQSAQKLLDIIRNGRVRGYIKEGRQEQR